VGGYWDGQSCRTIDWVVLGWTAAPHHRSRFRIFRISYFGQFTGEAQGKSDDFAVGTSACGHAHSSPSRFRRVLPKRHAAAGLMHDRQPFLHPGKMLHVTSFRTH
jgi:hypothetical protein